MQLRAQRLRDHLLQIHLNNVDRKGGYVCVPVTGDYTFWIASDDHGKLWLSIDADSANKKLIAHVSGLTSPRQWNKYATQQSSPIALVAGQQYYIEALYKEDQGGDNMTVGWRLPDGTLERPIPGNRLSPFEDETSTMAARITTDQELYSHISVYPNPASSGDPQLTSQATRTSTRQLRPTFKS